MPAAALLAVSCCLALLVAPPGVLAGDDAAGERLQQTFTERVGGNNSTYFQLRRAGHVRLVLESLRGDTDLYVSGDTLQPDYANYDLCSVTCGDDVVDVPASLHRPVGIAVYGYTQSTVSEFTLRVYVDGGPGTDGVTPPDGQDATKQHGHVPHSYLGGKEEDESILWTVFVSVLKVVFDILIG